MKSSELALEIVGLLVAGLKLFIYPVCYFDRVQTDLKGVDHFDGNGMWCFIVIEVRNREVSKDVAVTDALN